PGQIPLAFWPHRRRRPVPRLAWISTTGKIPQRTALVDAGESRRQSSHAASGGQPSSDAARRPATCRSGVSVLSRSRAFLTKVHTFQHFRKCFSSQFLKSMGHYKKSFFDSSKNVDFCMIFLVWKEFVLRQMQKLA